MRDRAPRYPVQHLQVQVTSGKQRYAMPARPQVVQLCPFPSRSRSSVTPVGVRRLLDCRVPLTLVRETLLVFYTGHCLPFPCPPNGLHGLYWTSGEHNSPFTVCSGVALGRVRRLLDCRVLVAYALTTLLVLSTI